MITTDTNQQIERAEPAGHAARAPATGYQIEGMEGLTQQDIVIPRWSLVQPTSKFDGAEGHEGEFRRNIDGAFAKALNVVILQISPTRLLWSGDLTDRGPECASRDAVHGSVYGLCSQCEFNPQVNPGLLRDRRDGAPVKICGYGYTYLLVDDVEAGSMALFGVMGTGVRPAKTLHSQFVQKRRPPFSALVTLSTALEKNDKGKYYVFKAEVAGWLDEAATKHWREQYQTAGGQQYREFEDEAAAAAVDPDDAPPF